MAGSIVFAGIAPHPPLLIPEIGGSRLADVANSQLALREFSHRLIAAKPDTIVLISPHSPIDAAAFTTRSTPDLYGDFRQFGAPETELRFQNDYEIVDAIVASARIESVRLNDLSQEYHLDHGALVPLYYLHEAGWKGPVAVIGFTMQSIDHHLAFGRAIRGAAAASGKRVAVVASGDLSHRLKVDGPYKYEPTAHLFDEQIVSGIASGNARAIVEIDPALRERAGECGYRSIIVALGAAGESLHDQQVLSYEGPFGVGYMVAILVDENTRSRAAETIG